MIFNNFWEEVPLQEIRWVKHKLASNFVKESSLSPKVDPDVIWTRNLLIWSQTRYRCATRSCGGPNLLYFSTWSMTLVIGIQWRPCSWIQNNAWWSPGLKQHSIQSLTGSLPPKMLLFPMLPILFPSFSYLIFSIYIKNRRSGLFCFRFCLFRNNRHSV